MKKSGVALTCAALAFLLTTGCASLLDRSYVSIEPHSQQGAAGENSTALRAENYSDLVSAVRYCVDGGVEQGEIQLYNYSRDVETDLPAACLAVTENYPLGAYRVDYIRHEYKRILSYYKVNITIHYRRTPEQVASIVSVTDTAGIRAELSEKLSNFEPEAVLRISAFSENMGDVETLLRQAYYDTPAVALGMCQAKISIYPETGIQRIIEFQLTYPGEPEALRVQSGELVKAVGELSVPETEGQELAERLFHALKAKTAYRTDMEGINTAYAAFFQGAANDEGLALAYKLLCDEKGVACSVVVGTDADGAAKFWNIVETEAGHRHVDLTQANFAPETDGQVAEGGWLWNSELYPDCREAAQAENSKNDLTAAE